MLSNILFGQTIQRNSKGFTLVELMVVVAIIGILVAIAVPIYINNTNAARIAADQANLRILNSATLQYRINENISSDKDAFKGISTDEERMQLLVNRKHIASVPEPQYQNSSFEWIIEQQRWVSGLHDTIIGNILGYNFAALNPDNFKKFHGNPWTKVDEKGFQWEGAHSGNPQGLIYFENNNSEYNILTTAQLGSGDSGGYGILFETSLREDPNNEGFFIEEGYILQFDRGSEVIQIRKRDGQIIGDKWLNNATVNVDSNIAGEGYKGKNDEWWTKKQNIRIEVSEKNGGKALNAWVGSRQLFNNWVIPEPLGDSSINHTGFRSWGGKPTQTVFYDLIIEEHD
jgi:prepilin-type N-terminal cleavage/methylation domain-containing protein